MLVQQSRERFRGVLRGKARGARVLDAITRELSLDFFVLYSSVGWLLGPVGQGAYAAANAELDAIAWARRSSGHPALSVAWGQLREGGMARRLVAQGNDGWSGRGLGWIGAREGFRELERLLREGATCAAVLPIDWSRFLSRLQPGIDADFFRGLTPAKKRPAISGSALTQASGGSLVESWRAAPAGARRSLLLAHLNECAHQVLGVEQDVLLDPATPLKESGLDSLMAVELRNVLTRSLGTSLPATLLFDYPSLEALVSYLTGVLKLGVAAAAQAEPAGARESYDTVAALSDAEAEALLLAELEGRSVGGG
jgi:acyl carrier protein